MIELILSVLLYAESPHVANQQKIVVRRAITQLKKETGVSIKPIFRREKKDPCVFKSLDDRVKCYGPIKGLVFSKPWRNRYYARYQGISFGLCNPRGGALVVIRPGVEKAHVLVLHELGHMLGATHLYDRSLMNPASLSFKERLFFAPGSRAEIKSCMEKTL